MIICCKQCGTTLIEQMDKYICQNCCMVYPVQNGIVIMEENKDIDLRIGDQLLDLHKLRDERKFYESFIVSDVEFYARLHSVDCSNFHTELLSPYLNDSVVADLGCGQLPYINSFPGSKIRTYYALDLNYESLILAKNNFREGQFPLILIQHGVKDAPFPNNSVDIAISSEVLEHLDDPIGYLQEIHRMCKAGGYLSLSTPCISMYLYPHSVLYLLKNPRSVKVWYKKINAHKYWEEVLSWHPGLRPKILRHWINRAGFSMIRHETRLWYYHTPIRFVWRFFSFLEKLGIASSGKIFSKYLTFTDRVLSFNVPLIKWCGIHQFILCKKI
jgi:ubiquinone/menaquinone biosynthesis C-methylase UbiE